MARTSINDYNYVTLLKACGKKKDICSGTRIYADILKIPLLGQSPRVASSVISMYARCGSVEKAQQVFDELFVRDVVSWNALIAGYIKTEQGHQALNCFKQMQNEGLSPDNVTYTCILKACADTGAIIEGKRIHREIVNRGFLSKDMAIGASLVEMYAKCGELAEARQTLDELPLRNVVTWNALIKWCVYHGQDPEVLRCFQQMLNDGVSPDAVTFVCILKACSNIGDLEKCQQIHDEIISERFLEKDFMLGIAVADMYINFGLHAKAKDVLEELPIQSVTCLDVGTLVIILKACGRMNAICQGKHIHDGIVRCGLLGKDIALGNALIDMYIKCKMFVVACGVFKKLPLHDVVSWNMIMSGYSRQGQGHEALDCFKQMCSWGHYPDVVTLLCVLRACTITACVHRGKQVHVEILSRDLLGKEIVLGNALIDMYAKCGFLDRAKQVVDDLPLRNIVSWSTLISGYAQQGRCSEALSCFEQMLEEGISPDAVTYICILKACGSTGAISIGEEIHNRIVNDGLLHKYVVLGSALVDMYAKCGMLRKALETLEALPTRNVAAWSALIAGYAQKGHGHEAVYCFKRMQGEGLSPNAITLTCVLNACGIIGDLGTGRRIHHEVINRGLLEKDSLLGNALVDMYAKCGMLAKAHEVLEELPVRDVVAWSALIAGYAQQGHGSKALGCFEQMQIEGLTANAVTFVCLLKACSSTGALGKGKQIHEEIACRNLVEGNIILGNALVDMYAKCGEISKAHEVLMKELPFRNVASWNALMVGYAQKGGHVEDVLSCFEEMQKEGVSPDEVTFLCMLNSCGHSGLVNQARVIFETRMREHGILPTLRHQACMVMVFGSSGHFDMAISVMKTMPSLHHLSVWIALLGACSKWGNLNLGMLALCQVIQVDDGRSAATAYDLMMTVFLACGMQQDAKKVEAIKLKYVVEQQQEDDDHNVGNSLICF